MNQFSRTALLIGKDGVERLKNARVAVFGIGGVGSYAAEALARSGVGAFSLFDPDMVCVTNINRQLIATTKTIGRKKVEVMRERILEINPRAEVECLACFFGAQNADEFDFTRFSYIVDAIDMVTSKLLLVERANAAGVPIISSMGAGNKLDATRFEVADIYETSVCPLAKVMRKELRARGVPSLRVVYSKEVPIVTHEDELDSCKYNCVCPPGTVLKCEHRNQVPGSVAFVPPTVGLIIAGEVVRGLALSK